MSGKPTSIYDFTLETLKGQPLPLRQFEGRPLLIVNTASKCGFTPQYKALEALWQDNREKGLVIIGVPSNDFGGQEPAGDSEIAVFCEMNYGVDFPMASKTSVSGASAHPLFKWIAEQGGFLSKPRWNFYKYITNRQGQLSTWFSSLTKPDSAKLKSAVAKVVNG